MLSSIHSTDCWHHLTRIWLKLKNYVLSTVVTWNQTLTVFRCDHGPLFNFQMVPYSSRNLNTRLPAWHSDHSLCGWRINNRLHDGLYDLGPNYLTVKSVIIGRSWDRSICYLGHYQISANWDFHWRFVDETNSEALFPM